MAHHNLGNIDEVLVNKDRPFQQTEIKPEPIAQKEPEPAGATELDSVDYGLENEIQTETLPQDAPDEPDAQADEPKEGSQDSLDDYGNAKAASKTYSQDEADEYANRIVRERIARLERNQSKQPEYNQAPQQQNEENWETQLEKFVENVTAKQQQKAAQQAFQAREQQAQMEFEEKFRAGKTKFTDFDSVVASQPITDVMVHAMRAFQDPAAFIYAASKRMPQEIQRIANEVDPYKQIVELGKLEERMRKAKPTTTKAPKPISRTPEDTTFVEKKQQKQPETIEEKILKDQERRLAMMRARRGR